MMHFSPNSGPASRAVVPNLTADNYEPHDQYASEYNLLQGDHEIAMQEESKHLERNLNNLAINQPKSSKLDMGHAVGQKMNSQRECNLGKNIMNSQQVFMGKQQDKLRKERHYDRANQFNALVGLGGFSAQPESKDDECNSPISSNGNLS